MKFSDYNLMIEDESIPEGKVILCNLFSGATFLIDKAMKIIIESKNAESLSDEDIEYFYSAGVLLKDDNIDEARIHSYYYEKQKFDNGTLSLTILLTMDCNLRCIYCYEGAGVLSNATLTDEIRNNIFDFIKEQAETRRSKNIVLWLFGGEPLLYLKENVEFLQKVQNYCQETGKMFETHTVTNGILCNKENLEILERFNCRSIQITLDGVAEIHNTRRIYADGSGSYDEVLQGIKNVVNCYTLCNPVIRINIDKTNINRTFELLELLKEQGLTGCYVDYGIVKGTTTACASYQSNCFCEEELGDVLQPLWRKTKELGFEINTDPIKKFLHCGLYSDSAFTISPTGDIYKCWDFANEKEHRVATIGEGGAVINTSYAYFDWMTRNPYEIEECRKCVYLPACGGGCVGTSFGEKKDYHSAGCYKVKGVIEKQIIERFKEGLYA